MNRRKGFLPTLSILLAFFLLAPLAIHPFTSPVCVNTKKGGFINTSEPPVGTNIQLSFEQKGKEEKRTHPSTHRSCQYHPMAAHMLPYNTVAVGCAMNGSYYSLLGAPIYLFTRVILI